VHQVGQLLRLYWGARSAKHNKKRLSYRLDVPWFDSRLKQEIYLFSKTSWPTLEPPPPTEQWGLENLSSVGGGGVKRLGLQDDQSLLSSTEVQNEWSYASTPLTCLHHLYREKVYLFYKCVSLHAHHAQSEVYVLPPPNIVGPQLDTCSMSPFWCLQFGGGSLIVGKFLDPCYKGKYTVVLVTVVWYTASYSEEVLFVS
jgi:hypothetical protein